MHKLKINKLKLKKILRTAGKIILLVVLWNLLLSSFAVCRIWMPVISFFSENTLGASKADIAVLNFMRSKNIVLTDLHYKTKAVNSTPKVSQPTSQWLNSSQEK